MPYIRQRGAKWSFTVEAGTDPVTGKRKQITRSGFKSENEALREALKLEEQIEKNTYIQAPKLREFEKTFFEHVKTRVTKGTYDQQKHIYDKYIDPVLGKYCMDTITYVQIERFYDQLIIDKVSSGLIRNISLVLRKVFNTAERWGIISKNPVRHVKPPAYESSKINVWTLEQMNQFLERSKDSHQYALYDLALASGMRIGELLGLQREYLDLDNGIVQVQMSLKYTSGLGLHLKEPKTDHSKRIISLPEHTINVLRDHLNNSLPSNFVFHNIGDPIYPSEATRYFIRDQEKAGVPIIRFHDLRHTHASMLLLKGVNPKVVAERLGHSSVATTLDIYSHVMPSMQKEVASIVNSFFVYKSELSVDK